MPQHGNRAATRLIITSIAAACAAAPARAQIYYNSEQYAARLHYISDYERFRPKIGDKAPLLDGLDWVQGPEFNFEPGRVSVVVLLETTVPASRNILPIIIRL